MSGDFYKEWRANAEVDYYPQLVILWLSTNSWYRSHYSEITGKRDREFLNKLRDDHSSRNKLFARFDKKLQAEGTKMRAELLNHIEGLFFALNSASLLWEEEQNNKVITFDNCLLNFSPKTYGSLIVQPRASGIRISDTLKLTDDKSVLFNGLLEIIYQVRCQLVHGQIEPNRENHEVVKQCYFLLHALMDF
ncbi:MAG: hypothetical protein JSR51_08770 [Proteobacteria bacterium]|nr:hypothetical protein [Pseudomonadota bacterium]